MRTTETFTISLPPAMAKQMEKVQKEEHRTRSELGAKPGGSILKAATVPDPQGSCRDQTR